MRAEFEQAAMEPVCAASEVRASSVSFSRLMESRDQVMSIRTLPRRRSDGCLGSEVRSAHWLGQELPGMLPGVRQYALAVSVRGHGGRRSWWGVAEAACADGYVHGRSAGWRRFLRRAGGRRLREVLTDYSQHGFNSTHVFRAVECVLWVFKVVLLFLLRAYVGLSCGFSNCLLSLLTFSPQYH